MKNSKSPVSSDLSPSTKKLKQARLPFKLISDVPPSPEIKKTRKRKLSAREEEIVPKIGKISKENDIAEDLVVISDDDSKDGQKTQNEAKSIKMNPFVKIVDNAWKKKQQKSKPSKKKGSNKKKSNKCLAEDSTEGSDVIEVEEKIQEDEVELMDVDEVVGTGEKEAENDPELSSEGKHENALNESFKSPEHKSLASENPDGLISNEGSNNSNNETVETNNTSSDNLNSNEEPHINKSVNNETETIKTGDGNKPVLYINTTPKRSPRNKSKQDKGNLDTSTTSSRLDESICSNENTPKRSSRSSSVTNSTEDDTKNTSLNGNANLTPKQLQKKMESAKKREEREKEKLEREKKRQQEKEERAKQKQEKEVQKRKEREEKEEAKKREREEKEEAKRKEKEEKEEQKRKEKEEKEKQKELERKQREEKDEQKRKEREEKEEQRRKEKEAKELEKQEQELKKKKAAESFVNFFVPKQKVEKDQPVAGPSNNNMLSSFTIKTDMRLAPLIRSDLNDDRRQALDNSLEQQDLSQSDLYLKSLKKGKIIPQSSAKTWPLTDKEDDDDVMIIEDELPPSDCVGEMLCETAKREKLRPKLLSFNENRRPPYWGTWRKKSAFVKPRRPFAQDQKLLDYSVDSDEEWEEEQEGESIDGSAAGSDDELDNDEYEVDHELFVPHGYLSDEEATMDEDDVLSLSPETQKSRLKHLEDEFESEMKKPTEKLKPRLYGLLWETADGGKPDNCVDALWNYFGKMAMIMNDPTPFLQPAVEPDEQEKKKVKKKKVTTEENQAPKPEKVKKPKSEKETKQIKTEVKKTNTPDSKKNQPSINTFLTKLKSQ